MSEKPGGKISSTATYPLSMIGLKAASLALQKNAEQDFIPCKNKELKNFLAGGLPRGGLIEWGLPLGRGGREVMLTMLSSLWSEKSQTSPEWPSEYMLWVHGARDLTVYPPAWRARGIDLNHIRFAQSENPLADLKPVFLDPLSVFSVIVLDSPSVLGRDECAYLARQARAHGQTIMVLRDYFLSAGRGNVWAKLRLNCWFDHRVRHFKLRTVRGLSPKTLSLSTEALGITAL